MNGYDNGASAEWETGSHSDIGGREEQQDRVLDLKRRGCRLLVLADGMGGHSGGALAAEAVTETARALFAAGHQRCPADLLGEIVQVAHERMNAIGREQGLLPHSTCVLLHLTVSRAVWAHVGDSRLYRFRNGRLAMRTLDHSVVELLRLQGRISEKEMKTHPDQNRLYRAVGGDGTPEADTDSAEISRRDGFVLASDGLWEHVTTREMEHLFRARNLAEALQALVKRAARRGGAACDNISVAAARRRRAPGFFGRLGAGMSFRVWRLRDPAASPSAGRDSGRSCRELLPDRATSV